jgi:hypothetical protein
MLYYTWHSEANVKSRLRMAIQSWLHVWCSLCSLAMHLKCTCSHLKSYKVYSCNSLNSFPPSASLLLVNFFQRDIFLLRIRKHDLRLMKNNNSHLILFPTWYQTNKTKFSYFSTLKLQLGDINNI